MPNALVAGRRAGRPRPERCFIPPLSVFRSSTAARLQVNHFASILAALGICAARRDEEYPTAGHRKILDDRNQSQEQLYYGLRGCSALTMLGGILTYQISGWFLGVRILASLNAEVMLFVFLASALAFFALMMYRLAEGEVLAGRSVIISYLMMGVIAGVVFRIALG
jgi:hypothetical protein